MKLDCAGRSLDFSSTVIMGVLNITPDSFFDGSQFVNPNDACKQAELMLRSGAQIIDIGGESTRPGAQQVSIEQELKRVIPIISRLKGELNCVISIDTSKPDVMLEAVDAGAGLINDVYGLRTTESIRAAAQSNVPVCIMHMQGSPLSMQSSPAYQNVVEEVKAFLAARAAECETYGISKNQIIIDPGFGFGKTVKHNITLLNKLDILCEAGYPVMVGLSRKSMIGHLLGLPIDEREAPSIALAIKAVQKGAKIIRTHDVKNTHDAIRMIEALEIDNQT